MIPVSASELCDIATNLIGKLPETETLHARFYGLENSISAISTSKDWATSFKVNVYPTSHKDDVLTLLKMIKIIAATLCVETKSATQSAQGLSETQRKFSNLLTSVPACRKTLRAKKFDRYFDFKQTKISTHRDVY